MDKIKQWLQTLNPNPIWCTAIQEAKTYNDLEQLAAPIVAEIGWLHLEQLANLIEE